MFHKIKSVAALDDYQLLIQFCEGIAKRYDIKPLFDRWEPLRALETTPGLFCCVQVDAGGYGVSWNDDLDISCDELWENGEQVSTPFDGLLSFGDATALWGLGESTLRKAVSYGKFVNGVDVQKFGKQWVVTEQAMRREYGAPRA